MQYAILCVIMFFCPYIVLAVETERSIDIIVDEQEISELYIEHATGSAYQKILHIHNNGESVQKIIISIEDEKEQRAENIATQSLVSLTRFHTTTLADELREILEKNDYDINAFCKKNIDVAKKWCDGETVASIEIAPQGTSDVPVTFYFDDDETDHRAYMVFKDNSNAEQDEIQRMLVTYHVPDKNIVQMKLRNFNLEKEFPFGDFGMWLRSGMRDDYVAQIGSENNGTENVRYTYFTEVESVWIGEKLFFSEENDSVSGSVQSDHVHVTMPRFGKMRITGGVSYIDQNQKIIEHRSDPINLIVWPVHFVIIFSLGSCFCGICVLLYKYIRKNMFGFRKNKKNNTQFTGTYIVQDTDNIISIAQMFGVPWKELAEYNKIDAPYILISGETISVPGPQTAVVENVQEDMQEQNVLEQNHVEQENVGMKNSEPAMQKIPTIAEQRGEMKYVAQRDVQRTKQDIQHVEKRDPLTVPGQDHGPIKRKVTFAAPQSMLAQPASEPTTRAIDIEWMRDDEEAYNEEMEFQRKSVNKRLSIVVAVGVCAIGGVIVWGAMQWMQRDAEKKVSVETLIEEDTSVKNDENTTALSSEDVAQDSASDEQGDDVVADNGENQNIDEEKLKEQETQATTEQKMPSEITVQVLNAGAATGAAGAVSAEIKNKGYKINSAQNAQSSYEDVMIYYTSEMKEYVDVLAQTVDAKYGSQKKEESTDVPGKYKADIVIVLGT